MKDKLLPYIQKAANHVGIDTGLVSIDYTENLEHGDFSSNVAMVGSRKLGMSPNVLAEKIVSEFEKDKPDFVASVSIAGPGFINFKIKDEVWAKEIQSISKSGFKEKKIGEKIMVEYTDPNPFKEFHIGHLMSNAIGESISRLIEMGGAKVLRANWQGDVGPHVAKAVWGMDQLIKAGEKMDGMSEAAKWGKAYAHGADAYEKDPKSQSEIREINKKIHDKSDTKINELYERGRSESLEAFEGIYKRLGTKFDHYFFEGTEGRNGEVVVDEFLKKGIFEESDGAVIFPGEKHGLHTRVFRTSQGLPTYEAKELGLNMEKFKLHPDLDQSIIITGNEQNDYFKVLLKVFELIKPEIYKKTVHMSHGLMRFSSGKMSSRKGNVITAESLIDEVKKMVMEKIAGNKEKVEWSKEEENAVADVVAVGAIKYTILRQSVGGDVIFDSVKSISFEGDSGPYLQYSVVRGKAVLEKARAAGMDLSGSDIVLPPEVTLLEKLIVRFPEIAERAGQEYAPQLVATYLINLAGAFNSYYASQVIINKDDPLSLYRLLLVKAFVETMNKGLWALGIKVPERM